MSRSLNSPIPPGSGPCGDAGKDGALPLSSAAREALIRRLEAWIEEEERLVEEIERRFAAAGAVLPFRPRV